MPSPDLSPHADLVRRARAGDRDAFGQLVSAHQTLVVSIAYAIGGDFARSEDIAQEAFVAAWRQLGSLRDESQFKSWLCGITRNLARNAVRQQQRRPDRVSESSPDDPLDEQADPRQHAVSREEAVVVWESLRALPETYREPLILFYREHRSIEHVAAALDLTEDAVRQRLTRGRTLLRAGLERTIERSLGSTTPGVMFTMAVASSISATAGSAAIAAGGAASTTTAKTGVLAKAALVGSGLALPVVSAATWWIGRREALRGTRSESQRHFVRRLWLFMGLIILVSDVGIAALLWRTSRLCGAQPGILDHWLWAWPLLNLVAMAALAAWAYKPFVEWARAYEIPDDTSPMRKRLAFTPGRHLAYRSKWALFGWPLLDIRFGHSPEAPLMRGTARGWIALGDNAHGVVFALGGVATGAIALGIISVGVLSIGVLSFGGVACAWVAIGWIASGFFAFGDMAFGTFAGFGIDAATGMIAVARHIAEGMFYVTAEHVRDMTVVTWAETDRWAKLFRGTLFNPAKVLLIPVLSLVGTNWLVRRRVRTPAASNLWA